ncbi:MAG: hypothetical protein U0900_01080 [Myxococcota bacterium]
MLEPVHRSPASPGREPDFELEIEIAVPRAVLHAFLCDLEAIAPLHPLIESIRALPPRPELPRARHYRVVDRIPVGPLTLTTVYTAALDPVADDEVHGHAWQSPGVYLHTVYHLEPGASAPGGAGAGRSAGAAGADDGPVTTRLREQVALRAPFGLRRFVTRQARDAHRTTLEKMKALLESRGRISADPRSAPDDRPA